MRYLVIVALLIVSPKIFGQEMEMIGGNLYHNKIPITVSMAVNQSMAVSPVAHSYFQKALLIRRWNISLGIFGGYEAIFGTIGALYNPDPVIRQFSLLDIGIGGVCLGIIPSREKRRLLYLSQGVKAYNEALIEEQ